MGPDVVLHGEDLWKGEICDHLSRYFYKIESVGLRKAYSSRPTAGIDRNEEITSLSPYVYCVIRRRKINQTQNVML